MDDIPKPCHSEVSYTILEEASKKLSTWVERQLIKEESLVSALELGGVKVERSEFEYHKVDADRGGGVPICA